MPNLSWGDAFAVASSVKPEELGEDFLNRTNSSLVSSNPIQRISEVAQSLQKQPLQRVEFQSKGCAGTNLLNEGSKSCHDTTSSSSLTKSEKMKLKKKKKRKAKKALEKDEKAASPAKDKTPNKTISSSSRSNKKHKRSLKEISKARGATPNEHTDKDDQYEENQVERVLEGRLISDNIMVLVEKASGKVFSSVERDKDGNQTQIGSINSKNEVILFKKKHTDDVHDETSKQKEMDEMKESIAPTFPYPTDSDDHCETPLVAYEHIAPLLERTGVIIGKKRPSHLAIYDPYYCNGSVKRKFSSLGYSQVYNEKEDCYKIWAQEETSNSKHLAKKLIYDVLVTNPPYSGDHIDRLMQYVTASSSFCEKLKSSMSPPTPWFLLMPNWVHKKDYYLDAIKKYNIQPFYLVPKKRYVYEPPKDFREKKASDTHKKSSPFVSMWYIWGGTKEMNDKLYNYCLNKPDLFKNCEVARSKSALRDLRRNGKSKKKK